MKKLSSTGRAEEGYVRKVTMALVALLVAVMLATVAALATPQPAGAIIHEIVGASCSVNGPPEPSGQAGDSNGNSFLRALQATGFISSIEVSGGFVFIHFDYSVPAAKFVGSGVNVQIPGTNIILVNAPVLSPEDFAAFAHCAQLNP